MAYRTIFGSIRHTHRVSELAIVSGEAVALDLPRAGLGSRTIAALIDVSLQYIVFVILVVATVGGRRGRGGAGRGRRRRARPGLRWVTRCCSNGSGMDARWAR